MVIQEDMKLKSLDSRKSLFALFDIKDSELHQSLFIVSRVFVIMYVSTN